MPALIIIAPSHGSELYILFYVAAFLVATGILLFQGIRNRYPVRTWLLITLFGILCFIIGNKAITIAPLEWIQLFKSHSLPDSGRSILGGIVGLTAGLMIAQRWLKFNRPVVDHLAYALPAGLAITRIGCLFGGCCFGTPTSLPWGIQYGAHSHAFQFQAEHLQIPATGAVSLPVHPTQLYDIFFCLAILLLVYLTRNRWKASGSRFLFVILCYAVFRFAEEFLRESTRTGLPDESLWGLKVIQWMLLVSAGMLALVLILRERRGRNSLQTVKDINKGALSRELLLLSTVPLFIILAGSWLDPFEKLTLWLFTLPLLTAYLCHCYFRLTIPALRKILPFLFLIALVTMSQDTIDQQPGKTPDQYKGWLSLEAFGSLGTYEERHYDCDGNIIGRNDRDYSTWGAGMAYHWKLDQDQHLTAGMNFYSASDRTDDPDNWDYASPAMNVFLSYDYLYAGGSLGMNVFFDPFTISDITPAITAWVGKKDILFGEARLLTDYYQMGRPGVFNFGLGSGLGNVDKSVLHADLCMELDWDLWSDAGHSWISGLNLAGDIWITEWMTLKTSVFLGKNFGGSFGLRTHLGKDRWQSKR
ncbi:MAG TPA: prolipoprotein diacylglyceryl transferase [Bacteroidales bacterium]|nr:prolipoprotein diacylglyceryl transferase [Bacteroidales bacterium]